MSSSTPECQAITFGAVGDIVLSGRCGAQIQERGTTWPFEKVLPYLKQADLLFGNMESVVLPPDYPDEMIDPQGLVSKFDGTAVLKEAGFRFMNMAANHVLDGGEVGMFHTERLLGELGIATAGVGRTQQEARRMRVLDTGGLSIGFLCYCEDNCYSMGTKGPCHAYYSRDVVLQDLASCRDQVDVLVVSVHAGAERIETPSLARRNEFREFAQEGATMVLGHHPHVPQGVELVDGALIAYSLGNFYFVPHIMPWHKKKCPSTGQSFILLARVSARRVHSFSRIPCEIPIPPNMRPVPLTGPAAQGLQHCLADLDRQCQDDEAIMANSRASALRHLSNAVDAVTRMNQASKPPGWIRRRLIKLLTGEHEPAVDQILKYLAHLLMTPDSRSWMEEVATAAKEQWQLVRQKEDPYHRPSYWLSQGCDERTTSGTLDKARIDDRPEES